MAGTPGLTQGGTGTTANQAAGAIPYVSSTGDGYSHVQGTSGNFVRFGGTGAMTQLNLFGTANTFTQAQTINAGTGALVLKDNSTSNSSLQFYNSATKVAEISALNAVSSIVRIENTQTSGNIELQAGPGGVVAITASGLQFSDGSFQNRAAARVIIAANVTWDAPALSASQSTTTVVTMSGAAFFDFVQVSCDASLQGLSLTGYVSAANTVTLVLMNSSNNGTPNLASQTFRVIVQRY